MMDLIFALAVALLCSLTVGWLTIQIANRYQIGIDTGEGSTKAHIHAVPRLGAIPIVAGLSAAFCLLSVMTHGIGQREAFILLLTLVPAFGIGLIEDFRQTLGIKIRLFTTMGSAALAWWLLDAKLDFVDIGLIDRELMAWPLVAFAVTLFAASGLSHALNIVDGSNGLSSFVSMVILCSIGLIAHRVGDPFVCTVSLLAAAAVLGFFVWNFPHGRLFLGDGGAYLNGMLIAELSILLVNRNSSVSPWFPLTLAIYPIWETLYSAGRRILVRGRSPGSADQLHMHSLVYSRLVRTAASFRDERMQALQSSISSTYMWALASLPAVAALWFWNHTQGLMWCCALFAILYVVLYRRLVRFRMQRLLAPRRKQATAREAPSHLGPE